MSETTEVFEEAIDHIIDAMLNCPSSVEVSGPVSCVRPHSRPGAVQHAPRMLLQHTVRLP